MKQSKRILSAVLAAAMALSSVSVTAFAGTAAPGATKATSAKEGFKNYIQNTASQFVIAKTKQFGGSHYAYTDNVSDARGYDQPNGDEYSFNDVKGGELVLLTYNENDPTQTPVEETLLKTTTGVVRDPDVSSDGKRLIYSLKTSENDDYHLYEMDLATRESRQLTFGQGISDTECKYLPNGDIVFSSTRDIQIVDCWKIAVSNIYKCDKDGKNIIHLGYDQVHTTYPTVTSDGRVIYTRWDYNDRNQMFIQGVYQMFPDGTNQTEVYGNNTDYPTTLLHTTEVPGQPGKYYSIASGHHTLQQGKLCLIDTTKDRNDYIGDSDHAVSWIDAKNAGTRWPAHDDHGGTQSSRLFKYPVGISENELFVSMYAGTGTQENYSRTSKYKMYYLFINDNGDCEYIEMPVKSFAGGASQIAPVPKQDTPDFSRPSMVNYAKNTGTYYVGSVYDGEAVKNLQKPVFNADGTVKTPGEAAFLRVVELEFRSCAIGRTYQSDPGGGGADPHTPIATGRGSWDVKRVLGVVDVEPDGSALFEIPSETPVYFQLLNKDGQVLQTMRSWSTLMPGESFSCVGCHENKNSVPPSAASTTMAMKKGVQKLKKEAWMNNENSAYKDYKVSGESVGFSFLKEVQPILDKSCVSCHNNTDKTLNEIKYLQDSFDLIANRSEWETNGTTMHAPFGTLTADHKDVNTVTTTDKITLKNTFNVTSFQKARYGIVLNAAFEGTATVKLNGAVIKPESGADFELKDAKIGENTLEVEVAKSGSKLYFDASVVAKDTNGVKWYQPNYVLDSKWKTGGKGGFGASNGWGDTKYNNNDLAIRRTITLDNSDITSANLSIKYDENPRVYFNGQLVWSAENWHDSGYLDVNLTDKAKTYLKKGQENLIAVTVTNNTGGKGLDLGLKINGNQVIAQGADGWNWYDGLPAVQGGEAGATPTEPFSLEPIMVNSGSTRKAFPASYLMLTSSREVTGDVKGADQGNGKYVKWLSSMSTAEIQKAKSFGSSVSPLITVFKNNAVHKKLLTDGVVTENEIKAMSAWIDLCVPALGAYDESNIWNDNENREWQEKENKSDFYEDMNAVSRANLSNTVENNGEFTMTYTSNKGVVLASETGVGTLELNVPSDLKVGDNVSIKLPAGKKYVAFRLDPRFKESIIYCPNGTFSYIVPEDAKTTFPKVVDPDDANRFRNLTLSARIPSDKELTETAHNLALNTYDVVEDFTAYPHATASWNYNNSKPADSKGEPIFRCRNAIDGFTMNKGHGNYPYHSWGPNQDPNAWFKVDFGRTVKTNKVVVYTRADFPHDTYYVTGTLEFSDGTEKKVNFYQTADGIEFDLGEYIETSYVKIKDLTTAQTGWAGLAEVEVYGVETMKPAKPDTDIVPTEIKLDKTAENLKIGAKVQLTATVTPANYPAEYITWGSSDPAVATVTMNGKVTVIGNGTATITATTHNGKSAEYKVTVDTKATGIALSSTAINDAEVGATAQLTATVTPANAANKAVVWASSNDKVATVDENGLVTFVGKGNANITATTADGTNLVAACAVTVAGGEVVDPTPKPDPKPSVVKVTAVAAAKASVKLNIGKKQTIGYTVAPANATDKAVTFKSANIKIATVDAKGVVTAKKAGATTVTITAHDGSGKQAIVKILVNPKKVTKVKAKKSGKKAIKVTFKKISGAKYQIQRRLGKGKWKTLTSKAKKTAYVDKKKLKKGKKYSYRVRAVMTTKFGKVYGAYSKATKAVKR